MSTREILADELTAVLRGNPWFGSSVYQIIDSVSFEAAFERPLATGHTIAEIALHMLSWTEETIDRLNGKAASLPLSGNWPDTGSPDEQKWLRYIDDLKLVNLNLLSLIQDFGPEDWNALINDERDNEPVTTNEGLVRGLIQHHIYHAGQIALLNRMING